MSNCDLILKVSCPDTPGLVFKISQYLADQNANVVEFKQFSDLNAGRFFARIEVNTATSQISRERIIADFSEVGHSIHAEWQFKTLPQTVKTALLVTKTTHCLHEILWRVQTRELPIEVTSIIGNQDFCQEIASKAGIPFHFVDFQKQSKDHAFRDIHTILEEEEVELVILARFMQIVPKWFCDFYYGNMINIHHSFLPAFIGANPYRQAYDRGVKLIGATCHYVTNELDAGPIIEQQVHRVEHFHTVKDLTRMGRDCERAALVKGIRYHVHDRIIIDKNRAVVFSD